MFNFDVLRVSLQKTRLKKLPGTGFSCSWRFIAEGLK